MKTGTGLILVTLLMVATGALALEQEGGIRLAVAEPTGDFGDSVENAGFGVALHYGLRPQSAFTFGIGLEFLIYGSETYVISLPLVDDTELTTTNNLGDGFLFVQLRPFHGPIQPYAEARLGSRYLWTESSLLDEDWWDDSEVSRKTNFDDFTSFHSLGGGLLIRLSKGDAYQNQPGVLLDFKVTMSDGAEAKYLREGDISIRNNVPVFNPSSSETNLTSYELGVVMTF